MPEITMIKLQVVGTPLPDNLRTFMGTLDTIVKVLGYVKITVNVDKDYLSPTDTLAQIHEKELQTDDGGGFTVGSEVPLHISFFYNTLHGKKIWLPTRETRTILYVSAQDPNKPQPRGGKRKVRKTRKASRRKGTRRV